MRIQYLISIFFFALANINYTEIFAQNTFETFLKYDVGVVARDLDFGDLNGDGYSDLVVVNRNSNTISVLTNTGNGTFGTKVDYLTSSTPLRVKIGDLNGDGKPDLVVACNCGRLFNLFTNTGIGALGTKIDYFIESSPSAFTVSDFNGDSKQDLAVANYISGNVSVLLAKDAQKIEIPATERYGSVFLITATSGLVVSATSSNDAIINGIGNMATATGVGVVTITAFQSGNGSFVGVTTTGVITVTKANLSVSAFDKSKAYGNQNPSFTYNIAGLVFGETLNITYSNTATSLSGIGECPISISVTGAALANYNLTAVGGTLTITKAPLTITSFNATKTYGEPNPTLLGTVVGIVNNDAIPVNYSTAAAQFSAPGVYPIAQQITPNAVNIGNYEVTTINGTLTINAKSATILGFNATKVYGEALPSFTGTILGVINNDEVVLSLSTSATSLSGVGNYTIVATSSGANINNYAFSITNSTLTITPKVFVSTLTSPIGLQSFVYNGLPIVPFVVGLSSSIGVNYTYNGSTTAPKNAGTYTIVGVINDANNAGTVTGIVTIAPASASIVAFSKTITQGDVLPVFNGSVSGVFAGDEVVALYNSTVTNTSFAGSYAILATATGLSIGNYEFSITNATLTIVPKPIVLPVVSNVVCASPCFPGKNITATGTNLQGVTLVCFKSKAGKTCVAPITATGGMVIVKIPNDATAGTVTISGTSGDANFELPLVTSISETAFSLFSIYPNPNNGSFSIELSDLTTFEKLSNLAQIYNAQGSIVVEKALKEGLSEINTALPKGIYLVKIGTQTSKLVVE
ncbi:MAG: MBG domain-containing protein [Cytophagales bacterium]